MGSRKAVTGDPESKKKGSLSPVALEKLNALIGRDGRMTQPEVGEKTGIGQSAVSAIIGGRRRPYADQLHAIADALGVSLDWLLDDTLPVSSAPIGTASLELFIQGFADGLGIDFQEAALMLSIRASSLAGLTFSRPGPDAFGEMRSLGRAMPQYEDPRWKALEAHWAERKKVDTES